jgi:DNA-binding PadR family transcriptional regulator
MFHLHRHGGRGGERRFVREGLHHERGEGGDRHGPFGRHGRHGQGRVFDHGDLRLVILQLIAEKPRHGYEIIKEIEEKLGGGYSPSPGVVYPTLTMLEELGHATVTASEGGKKLYAATPEGEAQLAANRAKLEAIGGRIAARQGGGWPAPVLRATENLKLALRLRLSRGPLSEDQARAIAMAIDAAALAVEQC